MHQHRVLLASHAVVALDALGEAVDAAYQFGGIVKLQLFRLVRFRGSIVLCLDVVCHALGNVFFADGEHQHLVVAQQSLTDGIVEGESVELLAINALVVHRAEDVVVLGSLHLDRLAIESWRGGHVEPTAGRNEVVVHLGEVRLVAVFQFHARGAVCLVADAEVNNTPILMKGIAHHINALVGGEDNDANGLFLVTA